MVEMRMAQHDRIERLNIERKSLSIARRGVPATLNHAAIQQQLLPCSTHDMARTGNLTGGAEKL